jgi:FkbM family methyltransferase
LWPPLLQSRLLRVKNTRFGPLMYNLNDLYIGRSLDLYGAYCIHEARIAMDLLRPGMTAVDVGANIGALTVPMAQTVGAAGRAIAIEAQRGIFHMLCGNMAMNDLANVRTILAAAGSRAGAISVPRLMLDRPNNLGALSLVPGENAAMDRVEVITLDSLALDACHLIKIDVEGMEREVLLGAADTIGRHRPFLYVENDRKDKSEALLRNLFELGYRVWWHTPPYYDSNNFYGNTINVFTNTVAINVLCLPKERPMNVEGMTEVKDPRERPTRATQG